MNFNIFNSKNYECFVKQIFVKRKYSANTSDHRDHRDCFVQKTIKKKYKPCISHNKRIPNIGILMEILKYSLGSAH